MKKIKCKYGVLKNTGKCRLRRTKTKYNFALVSKLGFQQFNSLGRTKKEQKEMGGRIIKRKARETQDNFFSRLRGKR